MSDEEVNQAAHRVSQGDANALTELQGEFNRRLRGYFKVRGVAQPEVEDAVQEVWIMVWKWQTSVGSRRFDPSLASFYTWLTKCIARFVAKKHRTRRDPDVEGQTHADIADLLHRADCFDEAFRLLFHCAGHPHEQLAFACAKHLLGQQSSRGFEGKPKVVAEKWGNLPLRDLTDEYLKEYTRQSSGRQETKLSAMLQPLRLRLALRASDIFANVPPEQSHAAVGDLSLNQYASLFGWESLINAITEWSYLVVRRLVEVIRLSVRACGDCKLNAMVPCIDQTLRKPDSPILREEFPWAV